MKLNRTDRFRTILKRLFCEKMDRIGHSEFKKEAAVRRLLVKSLNVKLFVL